MKNNLQKRKYRYANRNYRSTYANIINRIQDMEEKISGTEDTIEAID